jgi:lipopolysaccharide transport system ATP-binding protein
VGIIGPNGAGKSTLLKILSRITEPTEGRAEIHGRVACLLEVGTGFHPELTGRENVYLSGAFLGMRKKEIDRKLDEILAFAAIDAFLETPVKHYSSGMYVRLAFAIAAHLDPDILIVDEVLAVGDAAFQRKCLAKMEDVREHGRTILFVSHNLPTITRICERAILIDGGVVRRDGPVADVASAYMLSSLSIAAERTWPDIATAPGNEIARLRSVRVCDGQGHTAQVVDIHQPVTIEMVYDVLKPGHALAPWCEFFNDGGVCLFVALDTKPGWRDRPCPMGRFISTVQVPGNLLAEGTVLVGVRLVASQSHQHPYYAKDAIAFQVIENLGRTDGNSARGDWEGRIPGVVRPGLEWTRTAVSPHTTP